MGQAKIPKSEEDIEHERDKAKLCDLIETHAVDLIVVAANSLEARKLKKTLVDIADECKQK